jgi:hypothetical protein
MSDQPTRQFRTVVTLTLAARIAVLVAVLLLIAAAYMYWVPLTVPNPTGAPFRCRTAANPPSDAFAQAFCGTINTTYRYRALALLVGALVVGVGGLWLLGERRVVRREVVGPEPDDEVP